MYGLTHRFATTTTLADVTAIGASVTVMAIDRDRLMLTLVRDAGPASGQQRGLADRRPDVVLLVCRPSHGTGRDSVIMIDPEQRNALGLRQRRRGDPRHGA